MGTIVIEEYGAAGCNGQHDVPVSNLYTLHATTKNASTTSSASNVVLQEGTRHVSIYAVEAHRVVLKSDTTASLYAYIAAGERREFGVQGGQTLYYELDA